ncbi:hypothetical protein NW764_009518 [Fusarium oxysporum]|nr:hypothetical protein NW764_009518 [Fusarium oxysporum]
MTTTTIKSSTIISPSIPQTFRSRPKLMPPGGWKLPHLDTLLDDVDVSSPDRRRLRPSTAHFSCLPPHGGPVNGFVFGPSRSACFFFSVEAFNRARHFIFSVPVHRAHY